MRNGSLIDVVLSIDVEEDNWASVRRGLSVESVREIPAFAAFIETLGVRPTYFVNYQVAIRPWAATILREATAGGRGETAAHLHPWNTPPLDSERWSGDTMLCHYPAQHQSAKIRELTQVLREAFEEVPTTFRAGRFGVGPETISALVTNGYRVDSSVTPYISWERSDNGPSFRGAPLVPYHLDGNGDVRKPLPHGPLVEVPISSGLTWGPSAKWNRMIRLCESPLPQALRVPSVLARSGLLRTVVCSPETTSLRDMLALGRRIISGGVPLIHIFMHTTSLRPGLNPLVRSRQELFRLRARIDRFLEHMAELGTLRFRTVGEIGAEVHGGEEPGIPSHNGNSARGSSLGVCITRWRRSPRLMLLLPQWPVHNTETGLPWADLLQGLQRLQWEVHVVAASGAGRDHVDQGIMVHGIRRSGVSWLRRATARAREAVLRFEPDVILSSGPPDAIHVVGQRARGSRAICLALDLSTPPEQGLRFERLLTSWFARAGAANPIMILTDTEEAATLLRQRYEGSAVVEPVVGPTTDVPIDISEAVARLDEALWTVTDRSLRRRPARLQEPNASRS